MTGSRPLRFLLVVCAGWTALRIAFLGPGWWTAPAAATGAAAAPVGSPPILATGTGPALDQPLTFAAAARVKSRPSRAALRLVRVTPMAPLPATPTAPERRAEENEPAAAEPILPPPPPSRRSVGRFSSYAWAFLRDGGGSGLAPGGTLGGAQAGLRTLYRLNTDSARPLAVSVRIASPLAPSAGAEAAVGIDWRPARRIPIHVLAERRQKLGREGRSAFGLTIYGGVSDAPLGRLRVDAYAQAGIVGARSRDRFADGSLRLSLPLGRARLGAAAWAAAQPGVARVDIGPQASLHLPLAGRSLTLAADWRLPVAGNARPGSGPTLTVATDF